MLTIEQLRELQEQGELSELTQEQQEKLGELQDELNELKEKLCQVKGGTPMTDAKQALEYYTRQRELEQARAEGARRERERIRRAVEGLYGYIEWALQVRDADPLLIEVKKQLDNILSISSDVLIYDSPDEGVPE